MNRATVTPIERQAVLALAGIFSLRMLGLFMILPVFTIYAEQLSNVTPTLAGIAVGIYGFTQAALQIPLGFASDHFGRKPVIVIGLLLFVAGSLVAAGSTSIYGVIAGRSLQGVSAIGCVLMALAADLIRAEIRSRVMAILGITIGLSFALAMVLGPILQEVMGVQGIFWLTAILGSVAIVVLAVFVPTPVNPSVQNEAIPVLRDIPKVFLHAELSILNFGVFALHAILVALFLQIPTAVNGIECFAGKTWQFYVFVFLGSLILTVPCLLFLEKKPYAKTGLVGIVLLLILSELGIGGYFHSPLGLAVSLCLFFTAFNTLEASLPSLVSKLAPPKAKGTALGVYSSAQFFGIFIGGLAGGRLNENYGMVGILWFSVGLTLFWFLWIYSKYMRGLKWQEG